MQAHPQVLKQSVMPLHLARFLPGNQAALCQFRPRISQSAGLADPKDHLQVAKAARCFLEIGLETVGAVLEFGMALFLLEALCFEKHLGVEAFPPRAIKTGEKVVASRELPCFNDAGTPRDVPPRSPDALGDRAHAMAPLYPRLPH